MEASVSSDKRIKKIIIVGGGSSGWIAAAYLSKALNFKADISLIESEKIGRIGVGEATIISIQEVLFNFLGLSEADWMPPCNATFKMGIRYENWNRPRVEGNDHYYHVSGEMPLIEGIPLSHLWIKKHLEGFKKPLTYACYPTADLCDNFKSPKFKNGEKAVHYSYHFDALKMADFLKEWSIAHGVKSIQDEIIKADQDEDGSIKLLTGQSGNTYSGDLYIDCSGFEALLIGKTLQEPFNSFGDSLLTDRAVNINLPADPIIEGIRPYTTATALNHGWAWQIPLYDRSGNGYVFSSKFTSDDEAEKEIRDFLGKKKAAGIDSRVIKFSPGRRRRAWVKNCVAFGLANGFLEPLESTGIYFVYAALYQFMQYFPDLNFDPRLRDKFNERIAWMIDDVRNFIIIHFCTSPRTDTPFWLANKHDLVIPDLVQEELDLQKAGVPIRKAYRGTESWATALYRSKSVPMRKPKRGEMNYTIFEAEYDRFWTNSNYQMIFSGVNYLPQQALPILYQRDDVIKKSEKMFAEIKRRTNKLMGGLPTQYEYLKHQKFNYQPLTEVAVK